jgi:hypothetical protein
MMLEQNRQDLTNSACMAIPSACKVRIADIMCHGDRVLNACLGVQDVGHLNLVLEIQSLQPQKERNQPQEPSQATGVP